MVSSVPLDRLAKVLVGEITTYLPAKEVHRFLSTSKHLFGEMKYEFLRILISIDLENFSTDWSESEGIRSKIKDCYRQVKVCLGSPELPRAADLDYFFSLPPCALIDFKPSVHSISNDWIREIRKHNEVMLFGISDLTSFDFLLSGNDDRLRGLKKLHLLSFEGLTGVSALSHLSEVSLNYCPFVTDVSCLKDVRRLKLRNLPFLKEVNSLGNVYDLTLNILEKVEDISGLTNNRRLTVTNCPAIKDYRTLFNSTQLTTDVLPPQVFQDDHCLFQKVKRLSVISGKNKELSKTSFSHLCELRLINCKELEVLRGVHSIPVVHINSCERLCDISDLGGNQVVRVISCGAIEDFASLRGIPSVHIKNCMKFKEATSLCESKTVILTDNFNLRDVSMLGDVDHLELVGFCGITSFEGLGTVRVLKATIMSLFSKFDNLLPLQNNEKLILSDQLYVLFQQEDPMRAKKYHIERQCLGPHQQIYILLRQN